MAARKLQTEIDRTLKKVTEGLELFESIHEKLMASTNAAQKDKLENDLKSQIKKLQRLRDQIKVWLTSNDVKDKSALMENRKSIEAQMERFKAIEKEMKTKAFSKEGLIAATRLDPAEKAKLEARHALEDFVDSLSRQIEQADAEIEVLQSSATGPRKKGGKSSSAGNSEGRANELERSNERRKWHVSKLEAVMRLLENGKISVDQVGELKEDVSYFVESNQEEDFDEDEGIYDDLHLEEEEDALGLLHDHDHDEAVSESDLQSVSEVESRMTPARPHAASRTSTSQPADEISNPPSPVISRKTPSRKATSESKTTAPQPTRQPSISGSSAATAAAKAAAAPPLPPIKYAAAAAAAVGGAGGSPQNHNSTTVPPAATAATTTSSSTVPPPAAAAISTAPAPPPGFPVPPVAVTSPEPTSASRVIAAATPAPANPTPAPVTLAEGSQSDPFVIAGNAMAAAKAEAEKVEKDQAQPTENLAPEAPATLSSSPAPPPATTTESAPAPANNFQAAPSQDHGAIGNGLAPTPAPPSHTPNALSDLMAGFENAKQRSAERLNDVNTLHGALEIGLAGAPDPRDAERPRYYHPRTPYQTPAYYPQQPHPALDNKDIYSRMDLDTLFFIFYYKTNTYEQWCAAKELKRQSWRYHKQYLTWFQRLSQPQAITDEYEQGMYVYFDWENGWATRKKSDFRFEYYYLSED